VAALLAALAFAAGQPAERTLFKDLAPADPVREVVQTILGWPAVSVRRGFTDGEWAAEGFGGAWDRARRYFPARTYLVRPGTYFMTHGFDPDGRLFMEIHDSDYLELCAGNRRTFTAGGVVAEYARMRGADDGREAAAFRDKWGRLEPSCRDEDSQRRLREALGTPLHRRLLEALREENYHMLAGGLIHEGIHAGVDDASVARLQAEFRAGTRPVQWDELRAFMAESAYHARFCRWAARDISGSRGEIEAALRRLERLRRWPRLRPGPDRLEFERERAKAWAFAALARLRMRESWQSALRVEALVTGFRGDYVRGDPPADVEELLAAHHRGASAFVEAFKKAVQGEELALRSLEGTLDLWTDWADGRRPFPAPVTDSLAFGKRLAAVAWPNPPVEGCRALMERAEAALAGERPSR
jgi:hypothetical protein